MMQQRQELQAAAVPSGRAANDGETQTGHTSGNIHRAGVASLPGAQQPPLQPATGRAMKRPRDGAPPAAQDGGECDTGQGLVALVWSEEASRQLLQLRFQRLWRQFDAAQSATQLHEAWELLAAQLSGAGLGYGFDAAQCVAQLAKLRQVWEDEQRNTTISNNSQEQNALPLYALLTESFSWEAAMASGQQPSSLPATSGNALRMVMAVADQAPPEVEAPPKRRKAPVRRRKATPPAPAALPVPPRRPADREIARADEILLGLEKQAVLLERQTRAHQQQGDVMQKLLEVLAARMASTAPQ